MRLHAGRGAACEHDVHAIDFEVYFAPNAAYPANAPPQVQPGNLLQTGVNVTTRVGDIAIGGEVIWRHLTPQTIGGEPPVSNLNASRQDDLALMLVLKKEFGFGTMSFMGSQVFKDLTNRPSDGEVNMVDGAPSTGADAPADANEAALALLTNPVGSLSFSVNYELAYRWSGDRGFLGMDAHQSLDALTATIEVLAVIP